MNELNKDQKRRLMINVGLMGLTLLTLAFCVVAWFASVTNASIQNVNLSVENVDVRLLSEIEKIDFPCATKLSSFSDSTKSEFTELCAVERHYFLSSTEQLHTSVECNGTGMLAYVCESATGDYYTEMIAALEAKLGTDHSSWTFENIQNALNSINSRLVGSPATFNDEECTEIRIIYWVEYTDETEAVLNVPEYWESEYDEANEDYEYYAKITFTL